MIKFKLLVLITFCTSLISCSHKLSSDEVEFSDGIIWKYLGDEKVIKIPDNFNGEAVIGIGEEAFKEKGLVSVEFPETIEVIGRSAFKENQIHLVDLGDNIKVIGAGAFYYNQLTSVQLPKELLRLEGYAFKSNPLKNVELNEKVQVIEKESFPLRDELDILKPSNSDNSIEYKFVFVDEYNNELNGGLLLDKTCYNVNNIDTLKSEDVEFENGLIKRMKFPQSHIKLAKLMQKIKDGNEENRRSPSPPPPPSAVERKLGEELGDRISNDLFYHGIVIPETINGEAVTAIADFAFYKMNLLSVKFPEGIMQIGRAAFANNMLTKIDIPKGIETINDYCFCENYLTEVKIPDSVKVIKRCAFNSNRLTSVDFHDGTLAIGQDAFAHNKLANLKLPNHVKYCEKEDPKEDKERDETVYFFTDKMPEFPGGKEALNKYINTSIIYPEEALKQEISGRIYLSFTVEKDGSITDVKVSRGLHPLLDKEGVRIVKNMPKWIPGSMKGKIVRTTQTIPVKFIIQ